MMKNTVWTTTLVLLMCWRIAAAQELVLDDSLRGSTGGSRSGGAFGADGWRVTNKDDSILWHLPTLSRGAAEFSVRGLRPNDSRAEGTDKNELFHMYDWTYGNADTVYDGYRNNPFKHFLRKSNVLNPGKVDSMELVWQILPDSIEPDTAVLSWDPNATYRFREEWGPDGAGNCVMRTWRDGVLINTMNVVGDWNPAGHAVRIAASTRAPLYGDFGAPLDAVFSDVKVWRLSGSVAPPPTGGGGPPIFDIATDKFTLNGARTFLLGVSYFDVRGWRVSDLNELAARRFNLIRIWCDWGGGDTTRSLFDSGGNLVAGNILLDLVRAAYQRGIVVEVAICAPEGAARTPATRDRAVRGVVAALAAERNVFFDIMNEHTHGSGPISHAECASLFAAARAVNPNAILFVSCEGGHLQSDATAIPSNIHEELDAGSRILAPHTERTSDWFDRTDARVACLKNYLVSVGRNVPVYFHEEARRGHSGLNPTRDQFWTAARKARDAGAAGWIFHTDAGFELRTTAFFDALDGEERATVDGLADVVYGAGGGGGGGGGGSSLASGWEDGDPLGNSDLVLYSKDVAGPFNSASPPPECSRRSGETQRTGSFSLMASGTSNAAYAYCYYKLFDDDLAVQAGTKLKYWIYHESSSRVAIDGQFTDGSTIRDGGFADQNGTGIHPAARTDPLGAWTYVEVDLSSAAGKTLDFVLVGFDNGGDGFTGPYRAYIDDFSIGVDVGAPPPPAGPLVSIAGVSTGRPYSLATAQNGELPYIDRSYAITSLSGALNGGVLVRTANDDKYVSTPSHLTLTLGQQARLYVCYDHRGAATPPRWLDSDDTWVLSGETVSTGDGGASPMAVFTKTVPAGTVVMGGNHHGGDTGARSNYFVIVQPAASLAVGVPPAFVAGPLPAGQWDHAGDSDGDGLSDSFEVARGLDPAAADSNGDGTPDENSLAPDGRTWWDVQAGGSSAPSSSSGGGGGGGCGATGIEALILLGLVRIRRTRAGRSPAP